MVSTVIATKKSIEDDFGSQQKSNVRQPEVCVDYLSYKFDEMDLAASWRVMTKQKKNVVDGLRLENASWRTWAKQRNNLKTVSPQTLNWLKDSDVTWLYGPLHTVIRAEEDPFLKPKQATAEDTLGLIMDNKKTKPILKKVTAVDLLKRSAHELSPHTITVKHRKLSISDINNKLQTISPTVLATHRQPKLRFNHKVEQCVAVIDEDDVNERTSYPSSYCSQSELNKTRKSIKKIESARLKRSQWDGDSTDSILSSSESSMVCVSRSPVTNDILNVDIDSDLEEDQQPYICHASPIAIQGSSSAQTYQPESILVPIQSSTVNENRNYYSIIDNIANWATSYLWSNNNKTK